MRSRMYRFYKYRKTWEWIIGIAVIVLIVALLCAALFSLSRQDHSMVNLQDTADVSNGWTYVVLSGEKAIEQIPSFLNDYQMDFGVPDVQALKMDRIMTEDLEFPQLYLSFFDMYAGMEIFFGREGSQTLLYSDYTSEDRDEAGFLIRSQKQKEQVFVSGKQMYIPLPDDYKGKHLTVIVYFSEGYTGERGFSTAYAPSLVTDAGIYGMQVVENVFPMLVILACALLSVSLCIVYVIDLKYRFSDGQTLLLALFFALLFIERSYHSNVGYYSGFSNHLLWNIVGDLSIYVLLVRLIWTVRGRLKYVFLAAEAMLFLFEIREMLVISGDAILYHSAGDTQMFLVFLLFLVAWFVSWFMNRRNENWYFVRWEWRLALILTATVICLLTQVTDGTVGGYLELLYFNIRDGIYTNWVALLTNIYALMSAFMEAIVFFHRYAQLWKERTVVEQKANDAMTSFRMMEHAETETRRLKHEMRHQLVVVEGMLAEGEIQRVKEYIKEMTKEVNTLPVGKYSDNLITNVIIGYYLSLAQNAGIRIEHKVHVPENLDIRDRDLCVLLTNMLENAVEGCLKLDGDCDRYLLFSMDYENGTLFIGCKNSMQQAEQFPDFGSGQTSKPDKKGHGFGISSMNTIVKKYKGELDWKCEDGEFTMDCILII